MEESVGLFGYTWNDGWVKDKKKVQALNFPKAMKAADFNGMEDVGYHRTVAIGNLFFHQFWTWWPYNSKRYAGMGEHEGDWEMVQYGCKDEEGDEPVLASYSQHDGGEKRGFWRVELTPTKNPIVYVARDSHANYFERHRDVTDQADGQGRHLYLKWLEFGEWAKWNGKWGNSDNSPGPLSIRRAWRAPHAWHDQARG